MNRRSFLALAASPLLAPLLAACKSPFPAEGAIAQGMRDGRSSAEDLLAEIEGDNAKFLKTRWIPLDPDSVRLNRVSINCFQSKETP